MIELDSRTATSRGTAGRDASPRRRPDTHITYVLIPEEIYARVKTLLDETEGSQSSTGYVPSRHGSLRTRRVGRSRDGHLQRPRSPPTAMNVERGDVVLVDYPYGAGGGPRCGRLGKALPPGRARDDKGQKEDGGILGKKKQCHSRQRPHVRADVVEREEFAMSTPNQDLLSAFDGHDVESVRAALKAGADPCSPVRGKPPVQWLLAEHTRSDRLGDCLRLLFERGAVLPDPLVAPVLLNDAQGIQDLVTATPALLQHRTTLVSAFTSLVGVSLLHVAAEYGNLNAARALVEAGADVNARAEVDERGLNGHTPLFHTVNSNQNRAEPIMRLLLDAGARTDIRLAGIMWGKGYEWETTFFDVTPISYTQIGTPSASPIGVSATFMPTSATCYRLPGRTVPPLDNVPNRYLRPKSKG